MKLRALYKKVKPEKYKLKISYDKRKNERPAWIRIEGLPKEITFIRIDLGRKGVKGERLVNYKIYLIPGLFLPVDYTPEEMKIFYNKFSRNYNNFLEKGGKGTSGQNLLAANFLLKKIKKQINKGELLDLGAGTGLITKMFVNEGFYPVTLVDYSKGMLNKAKKIKALKNCDFIQKDLRKLKLKKKYDLVISFFSFGSSSYFSKEETENILIGIKKYLKPRGVFAVLGHNYLKLFKKHFKEIDSGIYDLSTKNKFYTDYFIGSKK
jgi:ubiquinone/menaquinone biosynthesis C-methylase UbiE